MSRREIIIWVIAVLVLPSVLYSFIYSTQEHCNISIEGKQNVTKNAVESNQNKIRVLDQKMVREMELEAYIAGVVLGEMPAEFESEALKAQAVASRTFTLRSVQRGNKHQDVDVCTDASCCQAYLSMDDYTGTDTHRQRVLNAVKDTAGQVITYQGNLIEATYFSCSGGKTEDAVAVWGTPVPYLQSVDSPGEEIASVYETTTTLSVSAFMKMLGIQDVNLLSNDDISITYTAGEGVETLRIGSHTYSGTQARVLLNLRSTNFTVEKQDDAIQIVTRGYGHRVGMSQYGAEAMAIAGCNYEEILMHYYSGVQFVTLSQEEMDAIFDKVEKV